MGVAAVLLIAAGVWFVANRNSGERQQDQQSYAGPTEEEERAGDEQKERLANEQPAQLATDDQGKQIANVIITDAGQYDDVIEVRAYIPNSYEEGTCTAVFTKGDDEVRESSAAFTDASYTICSKVSVARSKFPSSGTWTVTVVYSSNNYSGTANQSVEIQ